MEQITRERYYREVEKAIKACSQLPMEMQVRPKVNDEWDSLNLYEEPLTDEAEYRLEYTVNFRPILVNEKAFDKYYLNVPGIYYNNKSEVVYRDFDIAITVHNLRLILMQRFADEFLQPREE